MTISNRLVAIGLAASLLGASTRLAHARSSHADSTASSGSSTATWQGLDVTAAPTYFPADATIMVVAVGADAAPIATALLATLDGAMDGSALGDVAAQPDDAIVERALKMTATRVAVVRLFGADAKAKAVVTVYGGPGQVTAAFTIVPGKVLPDNPHPEEAGAGVRRDEMTSVAKTSRPAQRKADDDDAPDHPDAITYERNALVAVSQYGMRTYDQATFYFHGAPIQDTASLYDAMGRHDEAATFRAQKSKARTRGLIGTAFALPGMLGAVTFGTLALLAELHNSDYDPEYESPDDTSTLWLLTAASGAALVTGYLIAHSVQAPSELTPDEAISQVRTYNRGLGRSALLTPRRRTPLLDRVTIAPTASPSGGGMLVAGSF